VIAIRIKIREHHTHINLLARTKAHTELMFARDISSGSSFLDGKFAFEDLLVPRTLLKSFEEDRVEHLIAH
jgi:hypothetical protein